MKISAEDRVEMLLYTHGWCDKLSVGSFLVALFQQLSAYPIVIGVVAFVLGMYFRLKARRVINDASSD